MRLFRASILILFASVKNRVKRQLSRLRQPRYLAATAMGLFYFWSILFHRVGEKHPVAPVGALPMIELVIVCMGVLAVVGAWVLGGDEGALRFTGAEAQFLFPAPVSRVMLLRYKVGRTLAMTAFSAVFTTLLFGLRMTAHPGFFWVGAWLSLGTLGLHVTAASLARARLLRFGIRGLRRRLGALVLALGVLGIAVHQAMQAAAPLPPRRLSSAAFGRWAAALMDTAPLSWALFPFRAPIEVALAQSWSAFLYALPAAALVLALHYLWVVSSDVSFEEASMAAAELRTKWLERRRDGGSFAARRFRPLFRLSARGRPELALAWKNLIAAFRVSSIRLGLVLVIVVLTAGILAFDALGRNTEGQLAAVGVVCWVVAAFLTLIGPQALRIDLRQDLPYMDLLRSYPLTGRAVVVVEVMTPAVLLAGIEVLCLGLGAVLTAGIPITGLSALDRLALVLTAGLLLPLVTTLGLIIQNAGVLLFPAWMSVDARARGIEALGQRLLTLAGNMLVLALGLLPPLIPAALVTFALWDLLGTFALSLGAAVVAAALALEAWWMLGSLGEVFERFDPAQR